MSREPPRRTPESVAATVQLACLLEVSAPKPGNVSPGCHFADTRYEDFLASAAAIGGPFTGAGSRPLGQTVRLAIEATARWTRANTNLGIVLLLAPLARAACQLSADQAPPGPRSTADASASARAEAGPLDGRKSVGAWPELRASLARVLDETTIDDAWEVYAAIRLAAPGGLGSVDAEDVAEDPTTTLLEAMRLAAGRDRVAGEYATAFETTFETGAPALGRARREGLSWDDAVVETFLTLLAAAPDTHIARRAGAALAADVSSQARAALHGGGVRSDAGRRAVAEMDRRLRDGRNAANPGTTADLTAASIFVELLTGGWRRPVGH